MKNLNFIRWQNRIWAVFCLFFAMSILPLSLGAASPPDELSEGIAIAVSGTVYDDKGFPLPGVNILEEGTSNGTTTDIDGAYQITVRDQNAVLVFSFIGFHSTKQVVGNQTSFDITMAENLSSLDEVVVIGYGKLSRAQLTTAVSKVDADKLQATPVTANPGVALIGKVAGVSIAQTDGRPSGSPTIWIRGGTSTNAPGDRPLYVIDGVVRDNMDDLNIADISDFTILKDAASTAIYGARAANGVIVITTRRGKKGKGRVTFKYGYEYQNTDRYRQDYLPFAEEVYYSRIASARSYGDQWSAEYYKLLTRSSYVGTGGSADGRTSLQYAEDVRNSNGGNLPGSYVTIIDPITGKELAWEPWDWEDQVFQNGHAHNFNLDFSGGSDKGSYYTSLNYYTNNGTAPGTSYDRFNLTGNFDYQVTDYMKIGSNFNYAFLDDGMGGWDNSGYRWYERAGRLPSTVRYQNTETGEYIPGNSGKPNPDYWLDHYTIRNITNKTTLAFFSEIDIIEGLQLRPFISMYKRDWNYGQFAEKNAYDGRRSSSANTATEMDLQFDVTLSYQKTFAEKHHLNAVAGTSFINEYLYNISGSTFGAGTDLIPTLNAGTDENDKVSTSLGKSAVQSWFGRVNYTYDDRYLLSFSLRYDGASNFSPEYKWGSFPGVSAAWNMHNENFWNVSWMPSLKIRGSWGLTGKNNISVFDALGEYAAVQYKGNSGVVNTRLANDQLKWETTTSYDIGFDMGLLDNRINFLFDYYYKDSHDRLYNKSLPSYTGFSSIKTNFGTYINKGVEFEINYDVFRKSTWGWNLAVNWSYNKGAVGKLPENGKDKNREGGLEVWDEASQSYIWIGGLAEGERPDQLWAFVNDGIFSTQEEADAYHVRDTYNKAGFQYRRAGDTRWADLDGDGEITSRDQKLMGYKLPQHRGGMTNTLNYRGFQLLLTVDWALGHTVYDYGNLRTYANSQGEDRQHYNTQFGWMHEGDSSFPRISRGEQNGPGNTQRNGGSNSAYFHKGDYLAFREVALSYNLMPEVLRKADFLHAVSFNLTFRNLGWIKNKNVRNPAVINGVDRFMYPVPFVVNMGTKISF